MRIKNILEYIYSRKVGVNMKKIILLIIPMLLYILSFLLTKMQDRTYEIAGNSIMQMYFVQILFFVIIGISLAILSDIFYKSKKSLNTRIICVITIIVPPIIWIFMINSDIIINCEYYIMIYFIIFGMYVYQIIRK